MMLQSLSDSTALQPYIETSNSFYQDLLGYKPELTSLQQIAESHWVEFAQKRGLNPNSSGVYLPRNRTAIIQEDPLALFHEYFGHGLYCEQSLAGRKLVELEKKLLEEEGQKFQGRRFTLENIQRFRSKSQTFQELDEFRRQNLLQYELFAIWTEYLLSGEFDLRDDFGMRYDSFSREEKEAVDMVISFFRQYGDLATFYAFGLKKIQDRKRLLKLSQDIFGRKLERARLLLHFGSGKPFSDIDLFAVSDEIPSIYEHWIDVRAYRSQDIEDGVKVLNPMITDPVMIGRFISGDTNYWKRLRYRVLARPVTEEAIQFNLAEYETEMRRAKDFSLGQHLQQKNIRSAKTFLTNALALKSGDKVLTFNGLVDYAKKRLSHSERYIELKGV